MTRFDPKQGMGTAAIHAGESHYPDGAHVQPIYQTSTFAFPDVDTGAAIFKGEIPGYVYSRINNPNQAQVAAKIAALEGYDLLRAKPGVEQNEVVDGLMFGSGMAAISAAILARVKTGQTIIAQQSLYGATFNFLHDLAPLYGINVVWLTDLDNQQWEDAFKAHPDAVLAYAESPANPIMRLVDLAAVAEIAHRRNAFMLVDNTFASPYCQRPLTLGVDEVVHSTTKYLSGHGVVVGGTVVSRHPAFVRKELYTMLKILGGIAGPFDCWLTNMGLKTFELRMQRHCENALQVARFLEDHPKVARVDYPGLENFPDYELARKQMHGFGGMMSFELKGGLQAGKDMLNKVSMMTLAVSLGNVDTLIQHPASMTHACVPAAERIKAGLSDGLVRLSVGVENIEDILADLDRSLS